MRWNRDPTNRGRVTVWRGTRLLMTKAPSEYNVWVGQKIIVSGKSVKATEQALKEYLDECAQGIRVLGA